MNPVQTSNLRIDTIRPIPSPDYVCHTVALSDEGAPAYDHALAAKLAALGVPSFACTPDAFPGLMAAAIRRDDINAWAAGQGIVTAAKGV